jgi:hypothetical protein
LLIDKRAKHCVVNYLNIGRKTGVPQLLGDLSAIWRKGSLSQTKKVFAVPIAQPSALLLISQRMGIKPLSLMALGESK